MKQMTQFKDCEQNEQIVRKNKSVLFRQGRWLVFVRLNRTSFNDDFKRCDFTIPLSLLYTYSYFTHMFEILVKISAVLT